jgi:glycosyltransferase involved in cell wall biosynthesis
LLLSWRTLSIILAHRPAVIYFQNPSMVLCLLVTLLKFLRLTSSRTVGDFHNAGLYPPAAQFLVPWMLRTNDVVIVSNDSLRTRVEAFGGRAVAIPDPIPDILVQRAQSTEVGFRVLFVCSWASDEPIAEVLQAAALLESQQPDVYVAVTGRPKLERIGWSRPVPGNVELTGYLSEQDFEERLANCDAVLDLTTRSDCMVCGAYEAVSVGVPMILSDNPPTRSYFDRGAIYTDNSGVDIARAIITMRSQLISMRIGVGQLREVVREREDEAFARLRSILAGR